MLNIQREKIYKKLDKLFQKVNEYLFNKLNFTECVIKQFDYQPNNKNEKFDILYYSTTLDEIHHIFSKKEINDKCIYNK